VGFFTLYDDGSTSSALVNHFCASSLGHVFLDQHRACFVVCTQTCHRFTGDRDPQLPGNPTDIRIA
jgi:hypothetical protein